MRFTFTERKVEISDELKAYARKKFQKLDRYFPSDSAAHMTFSSERGRYMVEATVKHDGMYFRGLEKTSDMYASVDAVVDIIERQIIKNKTRLEKKLREGAFDKDMPKPPAEDENFDIVRRKRFEVMPMTIEEAILQMNLLGHEFYFFKNAEDAERASVIYKRHDKGYGLIESE